MARLYPQIAGTVAGRDVHAPAERYSEVREVPTYANALLMSFRRSPVISGMVVSERYAVMNVLAYRLRSRLTALDAPKHGPRKIRQAFGCRNICCRANT